MRWDDLSVPKHGFGMDKSSHPTLYNGCDYSRLAGIIVNTRIFTSTESILERRNLRHFMHHAFGIATWHITLHMFYQSHKEFVNIHEASFQRSIQRKYNRHDKKTKKQKTKQNNIYVFIYFGIYFLCPKGHIFATFPYCATFFLCVANFMEPQQCRCLKQTPTTHTHTK